MTMTLGVVDLTVGNLFSVLQASEATGWSPRLVRHPEELDRVDAVVLPGVGAFGTATEALRKTGMDQAIEGAIRAGKLVVGVCLGLQLLFEGSTEFGEHRGLGVFPGWVRRFPERGDAGQAVRIPHMGWADVAWRPELSLAGIGSVPKVSAPMYFVHSYMVPAAFAPFEAAHASYGGVQFVAAVTKDNVWGFQFHPERSGDPGLQLYRALAAGYSQRTSLRES